MSLWLQLRSTIEAQWHDKHYKGNCKGYNTTHLTITHDLFKLANTWPTHDSPSCPESSMAQHASNYTATSLHGKAAHKVLLHAST